MDKLDRVFEMHRVLSARRRPVPKADLAEALGGCSHKTVQRTARWMHAHLGAPIVHSQSGYFYDQHPSEPVFELPGLWFSESELTALIGVQTLLRQAQPGLLDEYLAPIAERIDALLSRSTVGLPDWQDRIRILRMAGRSAGAHFGVVAGALAQGQRLAITYHARSDDRISQRTVSPQRLTHFRDNWYLDAWCHTSDGLRVFSVDRITHAGVEQQPAHVMPAADLQHQLATSYGIFAGTPTGEAVLRFTAHAARWVADEVWHPQQSLERLDDGGCRLRFPYRRNEELVRDICRWGAGVIVEAPTALRQSVADALRQAANRYADDGN